MKKIFVMVAAMMMSIAGAAGQSWGDLLKGALGDEAAGAINSLLGGGFSVQKVVGTWTYSEAAVALQSDNLLSQAGGALASETLAEKIDNVLAKAGIKEGIFTLTFADGGKFTAQVGSRKVGGTYVVNEQNKTLQLSFNIVAGIPAASFTANVDLTGNQMSLLFKADKLLQIVQAISGYSNNATLSTISTLASAYDGVQVGFKMTK